MSDLYDSSYLAFKHCSEFIRTVFVSSFLLDNQRHVHLNDVPYYYMFPLVVSQGQDRVPAFRTCKP